MKQTISIALAAVVTLTLFTCQAAAASNFERLTFRRLLRDPLAECLNRCKDTRCSYRCKVNYNRQQLKKRSLSADVLENYMDGVAFGAQARRLRSCENQKNYLTYCLKAATSSYGCSAACEAAEERARTDPNHHMIGTCDESCNKKKSECYLNANGMC